MSSRCHGRSLYNPRPSWRRCSTRRRIGRAGATAVRDVVVDFGDGSEDASLGALAGSRTVAHVYATRGSYIVTATVTDGTGRQREASIGLTIAAASTSM